MIPGSLTSSKFPKGQETKFSPDLRQKKTFRFNLIPILENDSKTSDASPNTYPFLAFLNSIQKNLLSKALNTLQKVVMENGRIEKKDLETLSKHLELYLCDRKKEHAPTQTDLFCFLNHVACHINTKEENLVPDYLVLFKVSDKEESELSISEHFDLLEIEKTNIENEKILFAHDKGQYQIIADTLRRIDSSSITPLDGLRIMLDLQMAIASMVNPNFMLNNKTLLQVALETQNIPLNDLITSFIKEGVDVNLSSPQTQSPLALAKNSRCPDKKNVLQTLYNAGAHFLESDRKFQKHKKHP